MKNSKRWNYLLNSPQITLNILCRGQHKFKYDLMDMQSTRMSLVKRINLIRSGLNLISRKLNPWSWPIHMQIELTNYCNLKCPVCPTGSATLGRLPQNIDVDLYNRLLDEFGPYLLTLSL
jgi:hypothetical protein